MLIIQEKPVRAYVQYIPCNTKKVNGTQIVGFLINTATKQQFEINWRDVIPNNSRYFGIEIYTSGLGFEPGEYEYILGSRLGEVNRGLIRIVDGSYVGTGGITKKNYYSSDTYKYYED